MRLFTERGSHWYQRDGTPCHTMVARDGGQRPTTVRDARKLGLFPSVTNVLGVINKPELVQWKMEQAVLAALTLPRGPGEELDAFARRVVEDSQARLQSAVEFGTALHAGAEAVAKGLYPDPDNPAAAWVAEYGKWFKARVERVVWAERVLVNPVMGYAGTADLLIEHREYGRTLVDIKTQGVKEGADGQRLKPRVYSSWCYQLAAYRAALEEPVRCLNLIVNSIRPEAPVEHVWTEEEVMKAGAGFASAHCLWCLEKSYVPGEARVGE